MKVKLFTFILFFSLFFINNQFAKEILIYADNISYDDNENLIMMRKKISSLEGMQN